MRRRSWVIFLFSLFTVSLVLSQLSSASTTFRINEASIRLRLEDKQTIISLAIENPTGHAFPAHVRLEVLNPEGKAVAVVESDENIKSGNVSLLIPLPLQLTGLSNDERKEMLWYRLHYQLTPLPSPEQAGSNRVEGIVSLSEITPDIFQLSVTASDKAREGTRYRAQVRTIHPITSRPVKGVKIEAELDFDGSNDIEDMKVSGVTDGNGYASFDFKLPRKMEGEDNLELEIVASRGILVETASTSIDVDRTAQIFITTDKPLYQPGQVLHARALMFDSQKHALTERDATLEIEDPGYQTVFTANLKTSRFGIASADWTIPDNLKLGDYRIKVEMDDGDDEGEGRATVKISRYEIPNFAVQVKPDLPYYLPGQNAAVEVRADYLFGQPVKRGHVRVVRESERRWNYSEQKWEAEEGEKYEGETNEQGIFIAHMDFSDEHQKLRGEDYERFQDLSYAAYFTDATTNRTEQRRFDLRLTKSAIHVYLIEGRPDQAKGFPLQFYLSTYYADGAPAQCEVAITEPLTSNNAAGSSLSVYEQPLRTIKTNRYGVAKVSGLVVSKQATDDDKATLIFRAHDGKGASGRQANNFEYSERGVIRLETDKTIYRQGEPVRVDISASEPEMKVAVDVWQGPVVLQSQVIQLHGGRASVTFPYDQAFKDIVTITAYSYFNASAESRYDIPSATHSIIYPRERDLKLSVRLDQSTYKPGEEAHAELTVRDADGRSIEGALGVVVFDKAVEERARTDRDFGSNYGFHNVYRGLSGYEGELSGLTTEDFFKLDLSRPVPEGMELVAEIMLRGNDYYPRIFGGSEYSLDQREIFSKLIARQVKPLEDALSARYNSRMEYPGDEASLRRQLLEARLDFAEQRDPWGTPFRASFNIEREQDVLQIASAGADERFDTQDDFIATRLSWPYFRPLGETLNRAAEQYHQRTGGYIKDAVTVQSELLTGGVDFSAQRDRWGKPFQLEFGISASNFTVVVKSGGPNGKFETGKDASTSDDFVVWTAFSDYFSEKRAEMSRVLANHLKQTGRFPQNEKELRAELEKAQVNLDSSRDPWGQSYYVAFSKDWRSNAPYTIQTYSSYEAETKKIEEVSPLALPNNLIRVRSRGADGKLETADDFDVAALSRKEVELIASGNHSSQVSFTAAIEGTSGAIAGTITDPVGGVVANAQVTATHASSGMTYEATTDEQGRFIIRNLPVGFYVVRVDSPGFMAFVMDKVPVRSSNITRVDGVLNPGQITETVEITDTAGGRVLNMTSSMITKSGSNNIQIDGVNAGRAQISTPRLREYFPETLVWQPMLETDAHGRAKLAFKLADNITTWKMAVIGSTVDGEVGIYEKEIRAFQPFFVEHDPPRVLTEGDEIQLPVVLRNYLDKAQAVELEIKPESWFALTGPARKLADVASNDSSRETFDFRAVSSVRDGKQRITAIGSEASDAIEKPVTVHPDGEEQAVTTSKILGADTTALQLSIPAEAIKNSLRGELKLYPNLMSHVAESVEGILERPHGCGEQTISSTYPNLMILRFNKSEGINSPVTVKARRYLEEGYKRLLNYRADGGGFSYWGGGESANFALSAYALSFLNDARDYLEVDEAVLNGARDYLIRQQATDGSWTAPTHYGTDAENTRANIILTSYITRIIASLEARSEARKNAQPAQGEQKSPAALALKRALDFLARHMNKASDAYMLASYALAATDANNAAGARAAITRLRSLAHAEKDGTVSWQSESSTPFHGWGTAGRIETTALALQALASYCVAQKADCESANNAASPDPQAEPGIPQLMNGALLYVLRQKDRYGVWQSTQATINVLNALVSVSSKQGAGLGAGGQAEIIINGRPATSVSIPPGNLNNPILVDISSYLSPGDNQILIRRNAVSQLASAQAVSTFYVPWSVALAGKSAGAASDRLRLAVNFSKIQTSINEEVACKVEVGGSKSYGGMLLAEIGLPPGADVDRASLELAVKNSEWSLSRYDVLPDRLVVYLWSRDKGNTFEFKFRPRFGLTAQTAPSSVYDYYNPEARVVVAPTKFVVR